MYTILCFGIVRDIVDSHKITIYEDIDDIYSLKKYLITKYPSLQNLSSIMVAVNQVYATDNTKILPNDEIALIPPVSGG